MIHEQPRSWPIKSVHDWKPLIWARDAADIFTPIHVALATWGMVIHGYVIFLELPNLMVDFGDPSGRIHCYSDQISSTSNMWKSHPVQDHFRTDFPMICPYLCWLRWPWFLPTPRLLTNTGEEGANGSHLPKVAEAAFSMVESPCQSIGMDLEWLNVGLLSKARNQSHSESNPILWLCWCRSPKRKARNRIAMLIYPADSKRR